MKLIIVSNYYYPETGAAPNRITNLAEGLAEMGNEIEVICPLPNYPQGKIFENYEGKFHQKELLNKIKIHRYWIYPSVSGNPALRVISMFSFALSLWAFAINRKKIHGSNWIIIQNSPLLVSFSAIILFKKLFRKKIVLNISDLWPLSALDLGVVKKGRFYGFLEWIERFNYENSALILGQSEEILDHVNQIISRPNFLYRNIQRNSPALENKNNCRPGEIAIVYAGLLGVAQGVFKIIEKINFREIGVELDIYGQGNEKEKIVEFLAKNTDRGVTYKGSVSKKELDKILPRYQASIVPLVNRIKGAVPSKIFELTQLHIPILFCGGGEGAKLVEHYQVGITSPPGNYEALKNAIITLKSLSDEEYLALKNNCQKAASEVFNFDKQISELVKKLRCENIDEK
jgi:glycosyltransferase involved in cell wall biosynthesis